MTRETRWVSESGVERRVYTAAGVRDLERKVEALDVEQRVLLGSMLSIQLRIMVIDKERVLAAKWDR